MQQGRVFQLLGVTKERLELEDIKKFENMVHDKIQELEIELEDSDTPRERVSEMKLTL